MLLVFNKPYGVQSQFTAEVEGQHTLAEYGFPPRAYPLGRLDHDSEGLLLLSDEAGMNARLLDPKHGHPRTYFAQVEGLPVAQAFLAWSAGVMVQGRRTLPARAWKITPDFLPRNPPIRSRKSVPDSWLAIELREGRNRQVRRMTAAAGHPTLRLIRVRIGGFALPKDLAAGRWREVTDLERRLIFDADGGAGLRP